MSRQSARRLPWFPLSLLGLLVVVAIVHAVAGVALPGHLAAPIVAVATMLIFFVTGLSLSWRSVCSAAGWWRLVLPLMLVCYGLWPGFFWLISGILVRFDLIDNAVAGAGVASSLLGWAVLAVLPTTITSCVAMTSLARGNVAGCRSRLR